MEFPPENDTDHLMFEYTEMDFIVSLTEIREEKQLYLPEEDIPGEYNAVPEDMKIILQKYTELYEDIPNKVPKSQPSTWKMTGREVGDDRSDQTNAPEAAALTLTVQETVLGMKTSREDTGITNGFWNFCEVTTDIPCSKNEMFKHARKKDGFENLAFTDSPPIRVVIDTTKIDRVFSTSYKGKAKILGNKIRSSNAICSPYLAVANLFQDACLAVWKGSDPKYLPSTLGGCHCVDAYADYANTYLFMHAWKGGQYDRLYGTAVEEAKRAIYLTETGNPTPCIIAEILRDDDTRAFATFEKYVAIPDPQVLGIKEDGMPDPLYKRSGAQNVIASVETRLVQAKRLVPEQQAYVEVEKAKRINNYLFSSTNILGSQENDKLSSLRRRRQFDRAIHGHSAFMRLANRKGSINDITQLFKENWKPCVTGCAEFNMNHARWLSNGGRGNILSLVDIPISQDMYLRNEVSIDDTLKVGGIQLNVEGARSYLPQTTVSRVGLYEITSTMEEWCDQKISDLTALRDLEGRTLLRHEILPIFLENREWINDDTLLVEKAIRDTEKLGRNSQVCLISNDKRLANQMSRQANTTVVLVDPLCLPMAYPGRTWNESSSLTNEEVFEKYPHYRKVSKVLTLPCAVYIDTGSLSSALTNVTLEEDSRGEKIFYHRELTESGHLPTGKRSETFARRMIHLSSSLLITKVFNPRNKDPYRRTRQVFGRDSSSLNSYEWNRGETLHVSGRITRRVGRSNQTR